MRALLFISCVITLLSACQDSADGMALGTLERDRIELVASESEVITDILVQEGDRVEVGQALLRLDSRKAAADLRALTAARRRAAARVAELEIGPRVEKIAEAKALVEGRYSQLIEAEHSLKRVVALNQQQLASQARLDQSQAKYDSAVAMLAADQENLKALESGTTLEQLQQARQALLEAKARVIPAQIRKEKMTIIAPVTGVVDDILYELGEQPSRQSVVVVLLASNRTYAKVYIPQSHRAAILPGKTLAVHIDGVAQTFTGTVTKVSSDPAFTPYYALNERDRSRLTYLAEIDLDAEAVSRLPAGLPLSVTLDSIKD